MNESALGISDHADLINEVLSRPISKSVCRSGNQIAVPPPDIAAMTALKDLGLGSNHIAILQPEIGKLRLIGLPPPDVVAKGGAAVLEHLRTHSPPAERAVAILQERR